MKTLLFVGMFFLGLFAGCSSVYTVTTQDVKETILSGGSREIGNLTILNGADIPVIVHVGAKQFVLDPSRQIVVQATRSWFNTNDDQIYSLDIVVVSINSKAGIRAAKTRWTVGGWFWRDHSAQIYIVEKSQNRLTIR